MLQIFWVRKQTIHFCVSTSCPLADGLVQVTVQIQIAGSPAAAAAATRKSNDSSTDSTSGTLQNKFRQVLLLEQVTNSVEDVRFLDGILDSLARTFLCLPTRENESELPIGMRNLASANQPGTYASFHIGGIGGPCRGH